MTEPTITCPRCQHEVKLTESLAAPLIRATEQKYLALMEQHDAGVKKREDALRAQEQAVAKAREAVDEQVATRLASERKALAEAEARKARDAVAEQLQQAATDRANIQQQLDEKKALLVKAQQEELKLREERRKLQEAQEQFELDKQRAIDAERTKIREEAMRVADEQGKLRLSEKEKTIADLQTKLQEALRKAEQGSQQLQGEVQELQLEAMLKTQFPFDVIEPVGKGEFGGDALQRVCARSGAVSGSILWESKRTKAWSDSWLAKLRNDMRTAKADMAVLVTQTLPRDVDGFALVEDVWVTSFRMAIPLAVALREHLTHVAAMRTVSHGQQTKQEQVFAYLTGPLFRNRVKAVLDHYMELSADLDAERKAMQKRWAKRESQIRLMQEATVGMFGDLQAITGSKLMAELDHDQQEALGNGE